MLDFIVMQMSKVNHEKGYRSSLDILPNLIYYEVQSARFFDLYFRESTAAINFPCSKFWLKLVSKIPHGLKLVYVIGLHAVQFGNNWFKKIPLTAKLDSACGLVQFRLSSEFFESNYFQIGRACNPLTYYVASQLLGIAQLSYYPQRKAN